MNKQKKLEVLRHNIARYGLAPDRPAISLGASGPDALLGGGLRRGGLHEIFAQDWNGGGFAACLGILAAGGKPFFWVRPDYEALEFGALSATGFLELGGDPQCLFSLSAANVAEALAAGADILSCPAVGVLVLELSGAAKCLDLVAGRRLALLAEQSGVTVLILRQSAAAQPSAAHTRWQVQSAISDPGTDWGHPRFAVRLVRHRLGGTGDFLLQWNAQHATFEEPADIGAVAGAASHRQTDPYQGRIAV